MSSKRFTKRSLTSEMDRSVRQMLKLMEEDGDSFGKKAEMYYQKRPELISHVEEFYRMYRSLADRYDHVTGELRKNISCDLQSQGSSVSDVSSEVVSTWHSPKQRSGSRRSCHRAPGFDFFLGSDGYSKEGYESSTLDSESDSDDSSAHNYYPGLPSNSGDQGLRMKIIELEVELREAGEKLRLLEVGNASKEAKHGSYEDMLSRITSYEGELRVAKEKIQLLEQEVSKVKSKLQKYERTEYSDDSSGETSVEKDVKLEQEEENHCRVLSFENEIKILTCEVERNKNESSQDIRRMQDKVEFLHKDNAACKAKLEAEQEKVLELQDRIAAYKSDLTERDHEVSELKVVASVEKTQIRDEVSRLLGQCGYLETMLREREGRCRHLEEEIKLVEGRRTGTDLVLLMKRELSSEIEQLRSNTSEKNVAERSLDGPKLNGRVKELEEVIERQRVAILDAGDEKREAIRQLCFSIEHYRDGYHSIRQAFMGHRRLFVNAT